MKKILLTALFAVIVMMSINVETMAGSNDSIFTAKNISIGSTVSGKLPVTTHTNASFDYYKVVAPADGYLTFNFIHNRVYSGYWWYIGLEVLDNGNYMSLGDYIIYASAINDSKIPSIGVKKGKTYYIYVASPYTFNIPSVAYQISVSFKASNSVIKYEKEFNETFEKATEIDTNKINIGNIASLRLESDSDYYKIKAKSDEKISLRVDFSENEFGYYWNISVFEDNAGYKSKLSSTKVMYYDSGIDIPSFYAKAGKTYYILVESNCGYVCGVDYAISRKSSNNGLVKKSDGNYYYYKNGVIQIFFTGFVANSNGTWYVKKGKVDYSANGIVQGTYNGKTVYGNVLKGKLQKKVALAKNAQGQFRYVAADGFVDFHYNGLASNTSGTYKITNGKITFKDNGIIKVNGKSYCFVNSKLKTGPAIYKNKDGSWYVNKSGIIDYKYRGIYTNSSGKWYVNGGRIRFDFTGKTKINGVTYNIVGGKVK